MSAMMVGLISLFVIGLGCTADAQAIDLTSAQAAYEMQCSKCHGLVERNARGPAIPNGIRIASNDMRFAVAMPYGPSLRGVYGRTAGTVPNFHYSKAFMRVFEGMVWDDKTLDLWMTDSQKWARGASMFYRQPDPKIRRQIIDYLKANSP